MTTPTDPVVKWLEDDEAYCDQPNRDKLYKLIELAKAQGRVMEAATRHCKCVAEFDPTQCFTDQLAEALRDYERVRRECD